MNLTECNMRHTMKRTKYPIHPDFKKWENMNPPLNRLMLPIFQSKRPTTDALTKKNGISGSGCFALRLHKGTPGHQVLHGFLVSPELAAWDNEQQALEIMEGIQMVRFRRFHK